MQKILIAGDFCPKERVEKVIKQKNYGQLFDGIKPILEQSDYSIVNFEFPIVVHSAEAKPILKCGPNLQGAIEAVEAVKYAGFDCCTLANNHILDQGEQCCLDTKRELEKAGIDTVGVGHNIGEAGIILYKQINGETLAIINCCEHEFSIATESSAGANPINPIQQYYKIQEARQNADYVLVIVHGGHEHYQLPSPQMQEIFRFYIDAGADAIVNGHQHCYSGYEEYKGKPIFYGLGNLCFDNPHKRNTIWNEGYIVELFFNKNTNPRYRLIPYTQCNDEYYLKLTTNIKTFNANIARLNEIICNNDKLNQEHIRFIYSNSSRYKRVFRPYDSMVFRILERLHILSVSRKYKLFLCAIIQCESHRMRLLEILKKSVK